MARKKKHEEHENHERWLVSYADFITLLFAFFVVMYSISSVNEGKYRVLSDALLAAFRSSPKTILPIQEGQPAKAPQSENISQKPDSNIVAPPDLPVPDVSRRKPQGGGTPAPMAELATRFEEQFSRLIDEDLIAVRYNDDFVEVEIKSEILFLAGSTQLSALAQDIIKKFAKVMRNFPNLMRVEGFTDNAPVRSVVYPSNWELSAARAGSVVRLMAQEGVHPAQLSAVGYAEFRPIADNATATGRNRNRRVAIVVMRKTEADELREDLYLASRSKDGRAPGARAAGADGWSAPVDVTHLPVTENGSYSVIEPPLNLSSPVVVDIAPPVSRVDQAPREMFLRKEEENP